MKTNWKKIFIKERERLGSGHKLASETGISPGTIQYVCTGTKPSERTIRKMRDYLEKKYPSNKRG